MRASAPLAALLDGINAAAVGLLAVVAAQLGGEAISDVAGAAIALGAGTLLWSGRVGPVTLLLGGAAIGVLLGVAGWPIAAG
jgi:chromate transport protein ChrA